MITNTIQRKPSSRHATRLLGFVATFILLQAPVGCRKAPTDAGPPPTGGKGGAVVRPTQPKGTPSITADPNPVPAGTEKTASTTIAWDTGTGARGDVYVSVNGAAEKPFQLNKPRGSKEVAWIHSGVYVFRLYAGQEHKQVLAEVRVTRDKK